MIYNVNSLAFTKNIYFTKYLFHQTLLYTDVGKVWRPNPLPLITYQRENEIILSIVTQASTMSQILVEKIDRTCLSLWIRRDGMNNTSLEFSLLIPFPFENLYLQRGTLGRNLSQLQNFNLLESGRKIIHGSINCRLPDSYKIMVSKFRKSFPNKYLNSLWFQAQT